MTRPASCRACGSAGARLRGGALALLVIALLALGAGPAAAHGGGDTADGSNYDSRVAGVVEAATGTAMDGGELRWRVLGNDALLELRNAGDTEVVVSGYEGEPYLRVGPDGVFENVASPASILNDDRYGLGTIPPGSRLLRNRAGSAVEPAPSIAGTTTDTVDGHDSSTSGQGRPSSCR